MAGDVVAIRFIERHSLYNPGELAGFDADYAEKLVAAKVAEYVKPEPVAEVEVRPAPQAFGGKRK